MGKSLGTAGYDNIMFVNTFEKQLVSK